MENLSDVIKRSFQELYKKKHDAFGTVKERVDKMNEQRKTTRHDKVFEKRRIPDNMTPIASPSVPKPKREKCERTTKNTEKVPSKRLEMLAKWKAEKEKKKMEEKKKVKPVFKVTHIPINVGLPDLATVNKEIKGKPIKSKFAPPNHKFKPPSNIKPIHFKVEDKKTEGCRIMTRSQTKSTKDSTNSKTVTKEIGKKPIKSKKTPQKQNKNNNKKEATPISQLDESMSPDFPIMTETPNKVEKTPKKQDPPAYISPFVTISRGKNSARKEFEARRSGKHYPLKQDASDCTSPKAGAAYFTWRLDNQTERLQEFCDYWTKYKTEENPPEEATSMIDVAIGQTNLLITKKFVQFRGLIDRCENEDVETPVTCEDLHGFWDMMYIQVNNIEKRFENLTNLKANNWQEIIPETKKQVVKKKGRPRKNATASSGLKEAIQAARLKKQHVVKLESYTENSPHNKRTIQVKKTESAGRKSSPGLMMMKVAQYVKEYETPAKSILKNDGQKSAKSQSKSVLFQDDVEDIENSFNKLNLTPSSKVKTPIRRSMRLCRSKIF